MQTTVDEITGEILTYRSISIKLPNNMKDLIRKFQEEEAAKKTTEKINYENEQKRLEENEAKRRLFITRQTKRIIQNSGVLDCFSEIESEFLEGKFDNHDIRYDPSEAKATLIWVDINSYQNSITITIDPNNETMVVGSCPIGKGWKDKDKVRETIAKEFLKPKKQYVGTTGENEFWPKDWSIN